MPDLISPPEQADGAIADGVDAGNEGPPVDLAAVRELVLRAHPDVVPELVVGNSVAELLASVEPAQSAYARLAGAWADRQGVRTATPVPAGGGTPIVVDPDRLPAHEKIRRGLTTTTTKKG